MHLGDPDPLRDLGLGEIVLEAQCQDQALPGRERLHRAAQALADVDPLVAPVLRGQRVEPGPLAVVAARPWRVQRGRLVRGCGLHGLEHILDRRAQGIGHVLRPRRVAQLCRQRAERLAHLEHQLLGRAGHVHRPALVAEVAFELAQHGGHGIAGEAAAAARVVAVHRLQEPHAGDLHEILLRLAGVFVAPRQLAGEGHEADDHVLARLEIAVAVIAQQESFVLLPPLRRRLGRLLRRSGSSHPWSNLLVVRFAAVDPFSSRTAAGHVPRPDSVNYHPFVRRRNAGFNRLQRRRRPCPGAPRGG